MTTIYKAGENGTSPHTIRLYQTQNEELRRGTNLQRKDWVTLNRGRAKVGRTGDNLKRWGLKPTSECSCGHPSQTIEHIIESCELGPRITDTDLLECNDAALEWIQSWRDTI